MHTPLKRKLPPFRSPPRSCPPSAFSHKYRSKNCKPQSTFLTTLQTPSSSISTINSSRESFSDHAHKNALNEKKELLEFLSHTNLDANDLLRRLSTYHTPYSKLLLMAAEELDYAQAPISSRVETAERDWAIQNARFQSESDIITEKLFKIRESSNSLKKKLDKSKDILNNLNEDINKLQAFVDNIVEENNTKDRKDDPKEVVGQPFFKEHILDQAVYNQLWSEQQALNEEIESLGVKLTQIRETQMIELRNLAKRRLGYK